MGFGPFSFHALSLEGWEELQAVRRAIIRTFQEVSLFQYPLMFDPENSAWGAGTVATHDAPARGDRSKTLEHAFRSRTT